MIDAVNELEPLSERVARVAAMEAKLDRAAAAVSELDAAIEGFRTVCPEIEELIAYYSSDLWRGDFEAEERGELPKDLKRGVLSEDGIYDLLTDYQRLKELL